MQFRIVLLRDFDSKSEGLDRTLGAVIRVEDFVEHRSPRYSL
jgi:hypothetical protein